MSAGFRLGNDIPLWIDLSVRVPYTPRPEWIGTQSVSIGGVTTRTRRAVKKRWQFTTKIGGKDLDAALQTLFDGLGPWWFFDPSVFAEGYLPDVHPDPGEYGWFRVHFTDYQPSWYHRGAVAATITLAEV